MEPITREPVPRPSDDSPGDRLAGIRRQLDAVLGGERAEPHVPVDLRAYLLDPPPTAAEVERDARRRLFVRRGSLAGAAVLAVLLLAPMPGGGNPDGETTITPAVGIDGAPAGPSATTGPEPEFADAAASTGAIRVDVPPVRMRAKRRIRAATKATNSRAIAPARAVPAPATVPASRPALPAPASPSTIARPPANSQPPAKAQAPTPAKPTPAPSSVSPPAAAPEDDAGVLVPVM